MCVTFLTCCDVRSLATTEVSVLTLHKRSSHHVLVPAQPDGIFNKIYTGDSYSNETVRIVTAAQKVGQN